MRTLSNRPMASALTALVLALALAPGAAHAAATLVVDADGTYDAATTTCSGSNVAFTTIQSAVTASTTGDTILVCPGTYNESQITVNKGLTVQSVAGAASTIIDGGGGTGLAFAGNVVLNGTTGNILFDGFTVRNSKAGPGSPPARFNVRVGSTAAVTITVTNNVFVGTNNPADGGDYGLYAAGPNANDTLIFQSNQLMNHGSNTILIERHKGPTDVSYNTFTRGIRSGTISAYINMSHSGDAITNLQKVSHNTIDMANDPGPYTAANQSTAIVIRGALVGTSLGTFSNVEISHNTITNLRAFRLGIALVNSANTLANQALGVISNATISCNSMTWAGATETGSRGVLLQGYVTNPTITGNTISGVEVGFRAQPLNGHIADTATFQQNSVAPTTTAAIDWQSAGALAAENNWFGSASGPTNPGNPGGTGGIVLSTGPVDFTPWLTSGGDADPGPCFVPGCGNGTTNPGEDCDAGGSNGAATSCCTTICTFRPAGEECRPDTGICDLAETCTGASGTCPLDAAETAGTLCRASAGVCDPAEVCDGSSTTCPADAVEPATTTCRPAAGPCDIAETCDGSGTTCPADAVAPGSTICRPSAEPATSPRPVTAWALPAPPTPRARPSAVARPASATSPRPATASPTTAPPTPSSRRPRSAAPRSTPATCPSPAPGPARLVRLTRVSPTPTATRCATPSTTATPSPTRIRPTATATASATPAIRAPTSSPPCRARPS